MTGSSKKGAQPWLVQQVADKGGDLLQILIESMQARKGAAVVGGTYIHLDSRYAKQADYLAARGHMVGCELNPRGYIQTTLTEDLGGGAFRGIDHYTSIDGNVYREVSGVEVTPDFSARFGDVKAFQAALAKLTK